jgi:putative intracellular protease/amidase
MEGIMSPHAGIAARTLLFALALASAAVEITCAPAHPAASASAQAPGKRYVCTACGGACDLAVFDHPGTCPQCGMPLVEEGSVEARKQGGKPVAILLFDGVEIIDFTGPWEVFGAAGFEVYTVAATRAPVTTSMGMTVVPRYTYADAPQPAVLLVPGGGVHGVEHDPATLRWVGETSHRAELTLSVCNGAFIVASAGLLDGMSATTTFHLLPKLREAFPKVHVVSDRRYVDNGAVITAAGLSSGIDGALHVVERMFGRGAAQTAALGIEYDWHPEGGFVRARLADRVIPDIDLRTLAGTWTVEKNEGTRDRWDVALRGTSPQAAAEVLDALDRSLVRGGRWQRTQATDAARSWHVVDDEGNPWSGSMSIEPRSAGAHDYVVKLSVGRGT